ncbi:MAG: hypothetical protein KAR87_03360 [Candidatus Aenigmarchaeota archaeon]|nr:hypothetical protein [Candidatus Aenigmarchaeota archaeon]
MNKINAFLKEFKTGLGLFGQNIALFVNSFLLFVVYLTGVGFTWIFAKLVGKCFLDIKHEKTNTYWDDLNLKTKPEKEYYRQF